MFYDCTVPNTIFCALLQPCAIHSFVTIVDDVDLVYQLWSSILLFWLIFYSILYWTISVP